MSLQHSASIVKNGLICYLDPANLRSFESRENIFNNTNTLGWVPNVSPVKTLNAGYAPDDTNTAIQLDLDQGAEGYYTCPTLTGGQTYTWSIYVKYISGANTIYFGSDTGSLAAVNINTQTGVATSRFGSPTNITSTSVGNGWYRISFSATPPTTGVWCGVVYGPDTNPLSCLIWGVQLEKSSSVNSYIVNTGSPAITRSTTLIDLSGNSNNGTLVNGATYNSSAGGTVYLNGSNQYIDVPINLSTGTYTIMGAAKYYTLGGGRTFSAKNNNWLMGHWNGSTENYYAEGWVTLAGSGTNDTSWRIYTATGDSSADSWKFYVNGILNTGPNSNGSNGPNGFAIGSYQGNSEFSNSLIGAFLIYNRVLSDAEISQNHGALKGRYSI